MPLCFVSVGSNVERERNVRGALEALHRRFGPLLVSSIRETAAVGFAGDSFHNLAVGFFTDAPVQQVIDDLSNIEYAHGRIRGGERFGPRTLDLDLLLYGDTVDARLKIPRQEIARQAFVLEPLGEIAPNLLHPELNRTMATLWKELPSTN